MALQLKPSLWASAPRPDLLPSSRAVIVQRAATRPGTRLLAAGQPAMREPGQPLSSALRTQLEPLFAADLGSVRIHLGPSPASIGAAAFTVGEDIFLDPAQFDPRTPAGLRLLGHELTHVVQQRSGRLVNPYRLGLAIIEDPALEREAMQMSLAAVTHLLPASRCRALQRMEEPPKPWYNEFLENRPSKEWRRGQREEASTFARQLAKAAFLHMESLVKRNDRDGAKGGIRREDQTAADVYGWDCDDITQVAAFATYVERVVVRPGQPETRSVLIYAGNAPLKATPPAPRTKVIGTPRYLAAFNDLYVGENEPFYHAEIKLYMAADSNVDYIGVSKLCCLYCAAQLLAAGFRGFRGCSMAAFNNYRWLPRIDDYAFAEALWGREVAGPLWRAGNEVQRLFIHEISQGSTLAQAVYPGEPKKPGTHGEPDEPAKPHPKTKRSDVNQYPLDSQFWK